MNDAKLDSLNSTYRLSNGQEIPCVGFGTWRAKDGDTAKNAVLAALESGYRHIDTAAAYRNETSVGKGIKESGVPREEIFLTSKLWAADRGYESTLKAVELTLNRLGTDYLDLYLIHWPKAQGEGWQQLNLDTWRAMEKLCKEGSIRSIGLSNFLPRHLDALLPHVEIMPVIDQIEFHPGYTQPETVAYCRERGIQVEAWSPLGSGRVLQNPFLLEMAGRYDVSVAQLCIRFCLQSGTLPLPKSVTPSRILENSRVFDFTLSEEDMAAISAMEEKGFSGLHPDEVPY